MKMKNKKLEGRVSLVFIKQQNWVEIHIRNKVVLLSLLDFDLIRDFAIHISVIGYPYARQRGSKRGAQMQTLHSIVSRRMGLSGNKKLHIDHINRNKLDCRRENLRLICLSDNVINSKRSDNAEFVYYNRKIKKWQFDLKRKTIRICSGWFVDKKSAEAFRDDILRKLGMA